MDDSSKFAIIILYYNFPFLSIILHIFHIFLFDFFRQIPLFYLTCSFVIPMIGIEHVTERRYFLCI